MAAIFARDNDIAVRLTPLAKVLEQQAETSRSVVNDLGQMTETIITADNGMTALAQLAEQQEWMAKTIRNLSDELTDQTIRRRSWKRRNEMAETLKVAADELELIEETLRGFVDKLERMAKTIRNDHGNGNTPEQLERMAETLRDLYQE
jgi:ABC-type transporter Mla subunit MlaD